jgi:quercetin dioxygenase-like cupin family protein
MESFRLADNLAAFSVARILPGQTIAAHAHPTMNEVFFVLAGRGSVTLTTKAQQQQTTSYALTEGSFLYTAPGDVHAFRVSANEVEPLRMIYVGVTTD